MNNTSPSENTNTVLVPAILYGMQRTGSNYIEQLIVQNFKNVEFFNDNHSRCLPTHKHFRLYDEKSIIPSALYYNSFIYRDFTDFKKHVQQIVGQEIKLFVVIIKNPFSWYLSYKKHAKKNGYDFFKKSINSHYIIDYNLFYTKWISFFKQAPNDVLLVKYEDVLNELPSFLSNISKKFDLKMVSSKVHNPDKVRMSKRFSASEAAYYKKEKYINQITSQDKKVIMNLLDKDLISLYNY